MKSDRIRRALMVLAGVVLFGFCSLSAAAQDDLRDSTGTWILDEDPDSTLEISESGDGTLSIDAFFYRTWSMEGTASVTGDGTKAVFQSSSEYRELGILQRDGDHIIFYVIVSPEATGMSDFLMDHPFVYSRS